jgi:hypothetical protein
MKVFLDDERPTPEGWISAKSVDECIALLNTKQVSHLSCDNDLGEGMREGHIVLDILEEMVYDDPSFPIPVITVHSANHARTPSMKQVAEKLELIRQQQVNHGD